MQHLFLRSPFLLLIAHRRSLDDRVCIVPPVDRIIHAWPSDSAIFEVGLPPELSSRPGSDVGPRLHL